MSPAQFALAAICEETEDEGEEKLKNSRVYTRNFFLPRTLNSPKSCSLALWCKLTPLTACFFATAEAKAAFLDLPQTLLSRLPHYFFFPPPRLRDSRIYGESRFGGRGRRTNADSKFGFDTRGILLSFPHYFSAAIDFSTSYGGVKKGKADTNPEFPVAF